MSEAAAPPGFNGRCRRPFALQVGLRAGCDSRYRYGTPPVTDDAIGQLSSSTSLSGAVSRLGQIRFDQATMIEVFDVVARLAVDVVPGATGATLALPGRNAGDKNAPLVVGSHDRFEGLESVTCPSAGAILEDRQVHAQGDLSQWPNFARAAASLNVCDVIATPLSLHEERRGCLSVYSQERRFDQQAVMAVEVFARHAAVTAANALAFETLVRTKGQLTEGLRSRETIGLAKGILMRQECCSEADAFRILVSGSQRLNQKVRDVALHVVALTEGRTDLRQAGHD